MRAPYTRADYERLPEGFPAQLIRGELVKEPAPTYGHQRLVGRLRDALVPLAGADFVVVSPTDVAIDDLNVFQPDVVVLREIPPLDRSDVGIPCIVFEVLSPTSASRDRRVKRPLLLAAGVEEVWLLDPTAQTVEVWCRDGVRRFAGQEAARSRVLPGFSLVPALVFASPA